MEKKTGKGHRISKVEPGGIGEEMGMEPGDLLLSINGEEIEDIFDIRAFIEEYAAKRAAKRVTDEHLAEMEEILQQMERDKDQDMSVFVHLDMEFHGLVMDAAGSPALKRAWKVLRMAEWTYICALITEFSLDELIAQHRNIFRFLKTHEESSAGAYMFLHIKGFGNELAKYFATQQNS